MSQFEDHGVYIPLASAPAHVTVTINRILIENLISKHQAKVSKWKAMNTHVWGRIKTQQITESNAQLNIIQI